MFFGPDALVWEDAEYAGAFTYNLYRGALPEPASGAYGECLQPDLEDLFTTVADVPPLSTVWFYLVSGENPAGEGPLGRDSSGDPRIAGTPCD